MSEPGRQEAARPWLRLVLAISLDGRLAPPEGGAAQLGGPGDRRVLEEALAWADGCLVGAETLRRHGTTCLLKDPRLLALRRGEGRHPQPVAIAVSRSGHLPATLPFFRQPLERWLLAAEPSAEAVPGFSHQLPLASWPGAIDALAGRGLRRLVVLGGAGLAASLLGAGLIDELQLTLCPRLLGGVHQWLPSGSPVGSPEGPWQLIEHRALGGDELLLRYRRGLESGGG
ncbi:MAG: RibD family protein [Cyanobacteriota bacterium]|nr:RibD family protein [Cyanobacteriota bacterium]